MSEFSEATMTDLRWLVFLDVVFAFMASVILGSEFVSPLASKVFIDRVGGPCVQ